MAPIESAPLDARTPDVGAPTVAANAGTTVAPAAVKPAAPAAAADPAPSSAAGGAVRPIQVASFSKEENANRAAEALAKIGITAKPQKSESNGKAVWGVVVMGDGAMLQKIKDAGFADAYYLK
ncbi:MAG: SPOR domain-containing protein [Pseudomonadota bacterium]